MKKIFLLTYFLPLFALSQDRYKDGTDDSTFIRMIANNIFNNRNAAYNNLHDLTKNIGGRLAGSP